MSAQPSVPSEQVANSGPAACMPEMRQTHWLAGVGLSGMPRQSHEDPTATYDPQFTFNSFIEL
jgi:hypothetical protein